MAKILVVDDEEHIIKIIAYKLSAAGHSVISARDGQEGLEKARLEKPDLILLDVMMPRLDGFETLALIRRDPETSGIPVFILTVKGKEGDRLRGQELGADDYITKPFSPSKLLAQIEEVLHKRVP